MDTILKIIIIHMIISSFNWTAIHCIVSTKWFKSEYGTLPGELWLISIIPMINLLVISSILFLLYEMIRDYLIKWWKYDSVIEHFKNNNKQ